MRIEEREESGRLDKRKEKEETESKATTDGMDIGVIFSRGNRWGR